MIISEHDKSDYLKSPSEMLMNLCLNSDKVEFGGHDLLIKLRISHACCHSSGEITVDVDFTTRGKLSTSSGRF